MADTVEEIGNWQYKTIESLAGGLDVSVRSNLLEESRSPNLLNVTTDKKQVLTDTGYDTFGQVIEGTPRLVYQFRLSGGALQLLLITNSRLYIWASAKLEWQYIGGGIDTEANGGEPAGETNIVVDSIAGFTAGSPIGIELDDGTQHQTTINGAPSGSTIVITDAIPSGRTVPDNADIIQAVVLSGSDTIYPSAVTYTASDWFIFTNGVDPPQYYDGTSCQDIPNLPSSGNTVCRALALYKEYLLLLGTTEGGTAYPQRVRWCDTADLTEWATGNAGTRDLVETDGTLISGVQLGPYLILYKNDSVFRCEFVGSADLLFNFIMTIDEDGALSAGSIVNLGSMHVVFGEKNIYQYKAGMDWEYLSDKIYNYIFGPSGNLHRTYKHTSFALHISDNDEILFFYPSRSAQVPDACLRYVIGDKSWWLREFGNNIRGAGPYQRSGTLTWNDLAGSWVAQAYPWSSAILSAGAPTVILCGNSPLQTYAYNFTSSSDAGTDIPYSIETKDFQQPHFFIRVGMIEAFMRGSSVLMQYSEDGGQTWSTIATVSPGASVARVRQFLNRSLRSVRFRFSGTGGGFALEWLGIEFCLESEW